MVISFEAQYSWANYVNKRHAISPTHYTDYTLVKVTFQIRLQKLGHPWLLRVTTMKRTFYNKGTFYLYRSLEQILCLSSLYPH